jgi:hypothetical protein
MKYLFLSLLFLSACGDNVHPTQTVVQTVAATADVSIVNKFTPTSSPVVIQNLDLSQVVLNTTQSADLVLSCDGSFGNNVTNNGVTSGNVRTTGTTTQGTIPTVMLPARKHTPTTSKVTNSLSVSLTRTIRTALPIASRTKKSLPVHNGLNRGECR